MDTHDAVLEWCCEISRALREFEVDHLRPATLLALIHVESHGDPEARRDGSAYHGLLQIAQPYLDDALDYTGEPGRDVGDLMGDGEASIRATVAYLCRYSRFHQWHPTLVAVAHKAGAGTLATTAENVESGMPLSDAVDAAADHHSVPRVGEYLRRFERARQVYARELDDISRPDAEVFGDG